MAQTSIQIRIDESTKNEFTKLCDNLGLTVTTACCAFIKRAILEQRIPFELSLTEKSSKSTISEKINFVKAYTAYDIKYVDVIYKTGRVSTYEVEKRLPKSVKDFMEKGNATHQFDRNVEWQTFTYEGLDYNYILYN